MPVNEPYNPSEEPPLELAQMLYVCSRLTKDSQLRTGLFPGWRSSFPIGISVASTCTLIACENL